MLWQPIKDLPNDWQKLAISELPPLVKFWYDHKERLNSSGVLRVFNDKLKREIAIETGIIERLYTLDRGITHLFIEQGINEALIPHGSTDRPARQVVALIKDQEAAIEGLFDFVGQQRPLSTSYIKQLHQVLTQNQDSTEALDPSTNSFFAVSLLKGDWKRLPNNPLRGDGVLHEYCPPEQVASEMDRLIDLYNQHKEQQIPPEVEAAWLHHRFTQIHPFQDGNGRVARCLANLIFIQAGWVPLVVSRDDRDDYLTALEESDRGNLALLVNLFAKNQKQSFLKVLALSEQVLEERRRTKDIISWIADKLKQSQEETTEARCQTAEEFAFLLFDLALKYFNDTKVYLQTLPGTDCAVSFAQVGDDRSLNHRYQIIETAKKLGYFANFTKYHGWLKLGINHSGILTTILVSFHGLGNEYRGLLACSACAYQRDKVEGESYYVRNIKPLTDTVFQFSYADEQDNLKQRFEQWLEEAMQNGLLYWGNTI